MKKKSTATGQHEGGVEANSPLSISPMRSSSQYRSLRSQLQEQYLEYAFDSMRYEIEESLSRPFTRRRFGPCGEKLPPQPNKKSIWQLAEEYLQEARDWWLSVHGLTFVNQKRLATMQCEFRSLVAECYAVRGDYGPALRELRLAVSRLSRRSPSDQFHHGIACGLRAEVYLLRADEYLRRSPPAKGEAANMRLRFSHSDAVGRRNRAREDLKHASIHLNAAQDLFRDIRQNVSRWELLHELRAQVVIEGLLLRTFELDFDIGGATDDWMEIGSVQRELTEGLEAIRAGLDCSVYPHHLPESSDNESDEPERKHVTRLHKRLLSLWMNLMVVSFWALRFLSVGPVKTTRATRARGHAPRLAAMERFSVSGSRGSFWNRWTALNHAAGLKRFVDCVADNRSSGDGNNDKPGDVARKALGMLSHIGNLLEGTEESPPCMLREFILHKMNTLYAPCNGSDGVDVFQKALMASISHEPTRTSATQCQASTFV